MAFDGLTSLSWDGGGPGGPNSASGRNPFDPRRFDTNSIAEFERPTEVLVVTAQRPNPILAAIRRGVDWLSAVADRGGNAVAEGIAWGNSAFQTGGAYYSNLNTQNYQIAQVTGGMMRSSVYGWLNTADTSSKLCVIEPECHCPNQCPANVKYTLCGKTG